MAEKFTPYDSADYLTSLDDIAYYLEAALDEAGDDSAFITRAIGVIARSQNFRELARKVGMSRDCLYKALSNNGNPSFANIFKVARVLGLKLEFHAVACTSTAVKRSDRPRRSAGVRRSSDRASRP